MRNKLFVTLIIVSVILTMLLTILPNTDVTAAAGNSNSKKNIKTLTVHNPIWINDTSEFTAGEGITGGSGTQADPYIIENWEIDASNAQAGIRITAWIHDGVYFVIRNCEIYNGRYSNKYGVLFEGVVNGVIDNVTIYNTAVGIKLYNSQNNKILNSSIYSNTIGIEFYYYADDNNISNTTCNNNGYGVKISTHIGEPYHYTTGTIITNSIIGNNADYGIYLYDVSHVNISDSTIYNNSYGNIHQYDTADITITNCSYTDEGLPKDITPPKTVAYHTGTVGNDGWYIGSGQLYLDACDNLDGVKETLYKLDSSEWITYTGALSLADSVHSIDYYSIDKADNQENIKTAVFKTDATAPVITITNPTNSNTYTNMSSLTITGAVDDPTVTSVNLMFNEVESIIVDVTACSFSKTVNIDDGPNTITVTAADLPGNIGAQTLQIAAYFGNEGDYMLPDAGDWVISTHTLIRNRYINLPDTLVQRIIILNTGGLTLNNVTLVTDYILIAYGPLAAENSTLTIGTKTIRGNTTGTTIHNTFTAINTVLNMKVIDYQPPTSTTIYDTNWPGGSDNWHINMIARNGSTINIKNSTITTHAADAAQIISDEHYAAIYADEQAIIIIENTALYANPYEGTLLPLSTVFDTLIYSKSSASTFQGCRFYNNIDPAKTSVHFNIYAENNARLQINKSEFTNQYLMGAAVYLTNINYPIKITDTTITGYEYGVFAYQVPQLSITGTIFTGNEKTIEMYYSQINITNSNITGNGFGIYMESCFETNHIINSTFTGNTDGDMEIWMANIDLLNSTLEIITDPSDTISTINTSHYLHTHVMGAGENIDDADVIVKDVNTDVVFTGKTNQNGWIRDISVLESAWHNQITTTFTPHDIIAAKGNTKRITEVIDQSKVVTLSLSGAMLTATLEMQPASLINQEVNVWLIIKNIAGSYSGSGNVTVELFRDSETLPFSTILIDSLAEGEENTVKLNSTSFSTAGGHEIRAEFSSDSPDDVIINTPVTKGINTAGLQPTKAPGFETPPTVFFVIITLFIALLGATQKGLVKKTHNIQAADIARKAGLKYQDAGLICMIAAGIQKHNNNINDNEG